MKRPIDHTLNLIRQRLDQKVSHPMFDRQMIEELLTEIVRNRTSIDFMLSEGVELRARIKALTDNLRDSEIELGRVRREREVLRRQLVAHKPEVKEPLRVIDGPGTENRSGPTDAHVETIRRSLDRPDEQGLTAPDKMEIAAFTRELLGEDLLTYRKPDIDAFNVLRMTDLKK